MILPATEGLSEKEIFDRQAKLRVQMWNSEDNLSAKVIISRHTSKPEQSLFIL